MKLHEKKSNKAAGCAIVGFLCMPLIFEVHLFLMGCDLQPRKDCSYLSCVCTHSLVSIRIFHMVTIARFSYAAGMQQASCHVMCYAILCLCVGAAVSVAFAVFMHMYCTIVVMDAAQLFQLLLLSRRAWYSTGHPSLSVRNCVQTQKSTE